MAVSEKCDGSLDRAHNAKYGPSECSGFAGNGEFDKTSFDVIPVLTLF